MEIKYGRKRNGIKRELKHKINEWLETIEDEQIRKLAHDEVIVTGGSIASMLLGEKVNDYDVYFRTLETTRKVAEYYVNKFNENVKLKVSENVVQYEPEVKVVDIRNIKGETETVVQIYMKSAGVASETQGQYSYFELMNEDAAEEFAETLITDIENNKEQYRPIFISQNAITLSNKIQIVTRFYGEPDKIHNNYDFAHAMCYWDHKNEHLHLPAEALECLLSRTLIYRGSLYPIASVFRTKKFIERGWRISAGQQLKMMWQISELNLSNFDVLKEQLTGVDQAYMWQLIRALKEVESDKINSAYVTAIIEKIFD